MDETFAYRTTAEIDAKLHRDILDHEDKVVRIFLVILFILMFIFRGWIFYWLRFGIAIPSAIDLKPINVKSDPVQTDYDDQTKHDKSFMYKSLINDHEMLIIPQAHYVLPANVVAINHDFLFISDFFDSAALFDLGAAWGQLADKKFFNKYIKIYSQKVEMTGSRRLNWQYSRYIPMDPNYINSHISHSHIIPANRNIMAALLKLKEWDKVEIEGELVDMEYVDKRTNRTWEYRTSLSRNDIDETSRGYGACETIFVTKVKIGNRVYK